MDKHRFTIVTRPIYTREVVLRCPPRRVNGERSEAEESATYEVGDEVMRQVLKGRRAPLGHFTTRRRMICHVKVNGTIGKDGDLYWNNVQKGSRRWIWRAGKERREESRYMLGGDIQSENGV